MLRVASYNIRKAIGTDRKRDPARIMDVLAEIDADVIALQEADRRFGRRKSAIPTELIEDHGLHMAALDGKPDSIGHFGNAFLFSSAVKIVRAGEIKIPHLEPRGAIFADIEHQNGKMRIIGMHLDLSGLRRRQQIRSILAQAEAISPALPLLLMGDCNEWSPHGGSLGEFVGFHFAPTPPSFHSRRPVARLDRIIGCKRLEFRDAGTHHSLKARYASDHLPVWADVAFA